jgi:predicted metal-dependent phosphoesterase TrpH
VVKWSAFSRLRLVSKPPEMAGTKRGFAQVASVTMRADFHLHTHRSDGLLSPDELVAAVRAADLDHWAVTDHDTMAACRQLVAEAGLVPGVEITAGHAGREIHVVGLGVATDDAPLETLLRNNRTRRRERLAAIFARLPASRRRGVDISEADDGVSESLGRLHLARLLVAKGKVRSLNDAFERWLGDERTVDDTLPAFPSVAEVVAAIHDASGVALLAHPGLYGGIEAAEHLMNLGFDGIEVDHPGLGADRRVQLMALAKQRHWLMSAGSDLHFIGNRKVGDWNLTSVQWQPLMERLGML